MFEPKETKDDIGASRIVVIISNIDDCVSGITVFYSGAVIGLTFSKFDLYNCGWCITN